MKQFIKNYLGEIMTIVGTGIFMYNVFNFSYHTYGKGGESSDLAIDFGFGGKVPELEGIAYYYNSDVLLMIAIGAILITAGILIIKNKK